MSESPRAVDWYFDPISPYAYLQTYQFDQLPADVAVTIKPVVFAGLLNHWGQLGPAEIPAKREFTYRLSQWKADQAGIPFRVPPRHPFNPIKALRLAIALGSTHEVAQRLCQCVWLDRLLPDDPQGWRAMAAAFGLDGAEADARVADPEVKAQLHRNGDQAIAAGVFGVPTFVYDDQIFWGTDAVDFLCAYLADPAPFNTERWTEIRALPLGAVRTIPPGSNADAARS